MHNVSVFSLRTTINQIRSPLWTCAKTALIRCTSSSVFVCGSYVPSRNPHQICIDVDGPFWAIGESALRSIRCKTNCDSVPHWWHTEKYIGHFDKVRGWVIPFTSNKLRSHILCMCYAFVVNAVVCITISIALSTWSKRPRALKHSTVHWIRWKRHRRDTHNVHTWT